MGSSSNQAHRLPKVWHLGGSCAAALAVALGFAALGTLSLGSGTANAKTAHVIHIAVRNPSTNCIPYGVFSLGYSDTQMLAAINACRGREGVGPLLLPSNWNRLNTNQQTFVIINLERVNRGLAPVVGLTGALNDSAHAGAVKSVDPRIDFGTSWGSIYSSVPDAIMSDYGWMYVDGVANYIIANIECTPHVNMTGCWGHREVMLMSNAGLIGGAGSTSSADTFIAATLPQSRYRLTFSWARELRYFAHGPHLERAAAPKLIAVAPASVVAGEANQALTLNGRWLFDIARVTVNGKQVRVPACVSERQCTLYLPALSAGVAKVVVRSASGRAASRTFAVTPRS